MGAKRLPVCCACGRKFKPDPRNADRQRWCSQPECRKERDRARKRRCHRRRMDGDPAFRDSERKRCRKAMRVLRARRREASAESGPESSGTGPSAPLGDVLTGLLSQLCGSVDPVVLGKVAGSYADRGRRVSLSLPVGGSP